MTRGLMCISSKMPGWMKKSTCNESRAHIPGIGNDKEEKLYLQTMSASEFNNSMKMQTSDQHYSLHAA